MAKILILGGGFGGLIAAERLSKGLGRKHQITVISPRRKFTFYPALVRLAFGECGPRDISFSLTKKLDKLDVRFIEGEVIDIDPKRQRVKVTGDDVDGEFFYNYLIIAVGRRLATEKVAGFFEFADHLLGKTAALEFAEKVRNFKKGNIIVGLSPGAFLPVPVCETAFALARKFENEIKNGEISVNIVFPETVEDAFGGAQIHKELTESFDKFGIIQTPSFPIVEINEKEVKSQGGETLSYDLLMLLPPFRGHSFLKELNAADTSGFLITDEKLRVSNYPNVYAVGDIIEFPGPKLGFSAVEQARVAAANIISEIEGEEPNEIYYHEIAAIIDTGGAESIYLHYGFWDDSIYRLRKGKIWNWAKRAHDRLWQRLHRA